MELAQKVREFIESNLVVFKEDVILKNNDNIFERGFVDSMFALQLVSFIEEEFALELDNNDLEVSNFTSVDRIVNFIKSKKNI